ncbi:helix-turn-helix domain-containing protein [Escherichia coli]|uniref:helix-turn-helix domain-containing protein n=5 Tax=Gammaproteobacteria TaxID=1236 RepID=UPI00388DA199
MARVSISEAARLVKVSRPTIYKMINSGKLSYTSVVKHGKGIKVIDTSELIRVFGSLDGVIDAVKHDVKSDAESTGINSVGLHDLQHRIALLEAENDGLKGAVKARDEHIDSLRQAMQLLEHKHEPSSPPHSPWWKFWKNPDPAMLEFSSPAMPGRS